MNPHIIGLITEGYNKKIKMIDNFVWNWFGSYGLSAVSVAVEHNLAGRKAKSKFIDKPIFKNIGKEKQEITEEELQKQRELFVAKLLVMKSNFEINHPEKCGGMENGTQIN